jgi:hypothetical protein
VSSPAARHERFRSPRCRRKDSAARGQGFALALAFVDQPAQWWLAETDLFHLDPDHVPDASTALPVARYDETQRALRRAGGNEPGAVEHRPELSASEAALISQLAPLETNMQFDRRHRLDTGHGEIVRDI